MFKKTLYLLLAVFVILSVVSCTTPEPTEVPAATSTPEPTEPTATPEPE